MKFIPSPVSRAESTLAAIMLSLCLIQPVMGSSAGTLAPVSGRLLAEHCAAAEETSLHAYCKAYLQGVLDALDSRQPTEGLAYCLPDDITVEFLVSLYLSESRLYPEVLDVPASRLITGMVLKFFPCLRAQYPATETTGRG